MTEKTPTTFADLGLSESTLDALAKKGFEEPTEIQAKAIPLLLTSEQDIIAQAQTGTGKTATFGLVFTDRLVPGKSRSPQAIVLAPTRELAVQVAEELHSLRGNKNLKIVPIYGGQSWSMQQKHLRAGVDIVVGTPGRVMDHLDKGTLKLDQVEYVVLDEADEMLNMGFVEDIETILSYAADDRKMLLFSATMPRRISDLAKRYMKNPVMIKTQADRIANNSVDQIYFEVRQSDKFEALCRIIDVEEGFYGILFCRTKLESDRLSKQLNDRGYKTEAFHGDVTQDRREQILRNFRKKKTEVLVATDVAARGIDVKDLTHVINFSLPQNSESYVHRIGRTGRAGKEGKAITLITPSEYRKLRQFEYAAKAQIMQQTVPDGAQIVELKKKRILRDLSKFLENEAGLQKFRDVAESLFVGHSADDIVAALLQYGFADTLDAQTYPALGKGGRRRDEGGRNGRDNRDGSGRNNSFGPTRLFLTTGKKDGATAPKLLQMIENEFGVAGSAVGQIDIMDAYSFISVPLAEAETIMDGFHKMKKNGRPAVRIEIAGSRPGGGSRHGGHRRSGGAGRNSGGRRGGGGSGRR